MGHDAVHVAEISLESASDQTIWRRAVGLGAALVSKDEDFVTMRALTREAAPPVIWVRIGNVSRRVIIERFLALLPSIIAALERGETIIEIE